LFPSLINYGTKANFSTPLGGFKGSLSRRNYSSQNRSTLLQSSYTSLDTIMIVIPFFTNFTLNIVSKEFSKFCERYAKLRLKDYHKDRALSQG
jgi:hypothetical protein